MTIGGSVAGLALPASSSASSAKETKIWTGDSPESSFKSGK